MKTRILSVAAACGLVLLFTAVTTNPIGWVDQLARWSQGGITVSTAANYSNNHQIHNVLSGSLDYDFPVHSAVGCVDALNAITVTGAQIGDPCFAGVDRQASDAGNVSIGCVVSALNTVKVTECALVTNVNPGDAGYRTWVVSNQ